jgi:hypothetical protein
MFGSKKTRILADGEKALAIVTAVDYAKVAGMTIARNYNYKLDLTLMVRPDDEAPFEAHVADYFSQYSQPSVGAQFWVRYDPEDRTHVEIDTAQVNADNAAYEAQVAARAAAAVPADLAANGILGRGAVVDVQKNPAGALIDCAVTVGVRLVDGTEPYRASCHIPLSSDDADKLVAGGTYLTVRADPHDHSRIAISLTEPTPVVTVTDPRLVEQVARALSQGMPCQATILVFGRQWLQTPTGQEFYGIKVRVDTDGSEFQVNLPIPAAAVSLLQVGAAFPAKRLAADPNVLAIDWDAVLAHAPVS